MTDSYSDFRARVARIYELEEEASRAPSRPVSTRVDRNGYIVIRGRKPGFRVPWTGIMMTLVAVLLLKGAIIARLGPNVYQAQMGRLMPSTLLEQVGAWTLQPDPISRWVALQIKKLS